MIVRFNFPLECAEELVGKIPDKYFKSTDTKFYDPAMAGGQFIAAIISRLRECGHSDKNIAGRVFGTEINELHLNFGIRNHNLIGNFSTKEYNMKFDVIIGNPPYQAVMGSGQRSAKNHSIWPDFIENGIQLLNPNGCLAYITPKIAFRKEIVDIFHENDILYYNGETVKKYFPGIGSSFCSWVLRKSKTNCQSTIIVDGQEVQIKFPDDWSFIPTSFKPEDLKFIQKMTSKKNKLKFETKGVGYHSQCKELFSDTQTRIFKFPFRNGGKILYCKKYHPIIEEKKVIASKIRPLRAEYDNGYKGITENCLIMRVKSKNEGNKIVHFLNSTDIERFISLAAGTSLAGIPKILDILTYD